MKGSFASPFLQERHSWLSQGLAIEPKGLERREGQPAKSAPFCQTYPVLNYKYTSHASSGPCVEVIQHAPTRTSAFAYSSRGFLAYHWDR